jgi:hypothetical protein
MQAAARRVGAYMATVELPALMGHSLQDLASWNETDEETAHAIKQVLNNKADISFMGNDMQLLAGATLAFTLDPKGYEDQTTRLMDALEDSYADDYYWGVSRLHFLVDYGRTKKVGDKIILPPFRERLLRSDLKRDAQRRPRDEEA